MFSSCGKIHIKWCKLENDLILTWRKWHLITSLHSTYHPFFCFMHTQGHAARIAHLSDTIKGRTFCQAEAICMWMRLSPVVARREWFISLPTLQRVTYSCLELRSAENQAKCKTGLLCWGKKKTSFVVSKLSGVARFGVLNESVFAFHGFDFFLAERTCFWGEIWGSEDSAIGHLKH